MTGDAPTAAAWGLTPFRVLVLGGVVFVAGLVAVKHRSLTLRADSRQIAVVVALCNGSDYLRSPASFQLARAELLAASLRAHDGDGAGALVAITHGFGGAALMRMRRAGYHIEERSRAELDQVALAPRHTETPGKKFPRQPQAKFLSVAHVGVRPDGRCTCLKLFAWNLLRYDAVLLADTDVAFVANPWPWVRARLAEDEYFFAGEEWDSSRQNYRGLNSHLVFLRPSTMAFRMLRDASVAGNFIPRTNGEQDVVESLFTTHRRSLRLPAHWHSKMIWCSCRSLMIAHVNGCGSRNSCESKDKRQGFAELAELVRNDAFQLCPAELSLAAAACPKDGCWPHVVPRNHDTCAGCVTLMCGGNVTRRRGYPPPLFESRRHWFGGSGGGLPEVVAALGPR